MTYLTRSPAAAEEELAEQPSPGCHSALPLRNLLSEAGFCPHHPRGTCQQRASRQQARPNQPKRSPKRTTRKSIEAVAKHCQARPARLLKVRKTTREKHCRRPSVQDWVGEPPESEPVLSRAEQAQRAVGQSCRHVGDDLGGRQKLFFLVSIGMGRQCNATRNKLGFFVCDS